MVAAQSAEAVAEELRAIARAAEPPPGDTRVGLGAESAGSADFVWSDAPSSSFRTGETSSAGKSSATPSSARLRARDAERRTRVPTGYANRRRR